jgi:maleate cis-trans isomerase
MSDAREDDVMRDSVGVSLFLGMLTPSSNTALDPYTAAMMADIPDVTAHVERLKASKISLRDRVLVQIEAMKPPSM